MSLVGNQGWARRVRYLMFRGVRLGRISHLISRGAVAEARGQCTVRSNALWDHPCEQTGMTENITFPWADPGFLVGGDTNPLGGYGNIQICQIFRKNCMKFKNIWSVGGHMPGAPSPLDPPLLPVTFLMGGTKCYISLICDMALNLIAIRKLYLSETPYRLQCISKVFAIY